MTETKTKDRPKDRALCGSLWDRVFQTSKDICPDCRRIDRELGLNALKGA